MSSRTCHRLLLVEDDLELAGVVAKTLREMTCAVTQVSSARIARRELQDREWDLVVLDANLPDGDGFDLCRELRRRCTATAVLMLTARASAADRITGLELGADDYLTKPFRLRELFLRSANLLRRKSETLAPDDERLVCGDVVVDLASRCAYVADKEIALAPREFDLLAHLCAHAGRVFSREELLNAVWGAAFDGFDHTVNSHINRLRAKMESDPRRPKRLVTVWGAGYRLVAPAAQRRPPL